MSDTIVQLKETIRSLEREVLQLRSAKSVLEGDLAIANSQIRHLKQLKTPPPPVALETQARRATGR